AGVFWPVAASLVGRDVVPRASPRSWPRAKMRSGAPVPGPGLVAGAAGPGGRRTMIVIFGHPFLEAFQALRDVAHHVRKAPLAEQQDDDDRQDQQMPDAERAHFEISEYVSSG